MPLIDGRWHVVRGDCLWNISLYVYGTGTKWPIIADANGVPRGNPVIYPGQVFTIPGVTTPTPVPQPAPQPPAVTLPTINWFALDAGTTRTMFCTWSFDRSGTSGYQVNWDYDTGAGGWRIGSHGTTGDKQSEYTAPENAKKVRVSITPYSESWSGGQTSSREYSFSNNPPGLPPSPDYSIDNNNVLTCEFTNIDDDINADSIEVAIYQDDIYKYKTGSATINQETRYCKFTTDVDPGHRYKVRVRACRGTIYGGWSDYTDNDYSLPIGPEEITYLISKVISEQMTREYAVQVEWTESPSAKTYLVEWATNIEYFDTGQASSQQTQEDDGTKLLIPNIDIGHTYYFRVKSVNEKGISKEYTPIKSVAVGTRPSAPTVWSNINSCVLGEDLNLYWVHNSTDGSLESYARIRFLVIDSAHPELEPLEIIKVIPNEKPEEERNQTSIYTINTDDPDWVTVGEGYIIKWKVQTAGVTSEYSEWSTEREINVYSKPEIQLDIINSSSVSISEVNSYPFYISVLATPPSQIPLSYYIEIVSTQSYQTVDSIGNIKYVNAGDKVYQKHYDPQDNPWRFLLEMTPGIVDLINDIVYTVNVTLSMNSGLTAKSSINFTMSFEEIYYDVFGEISYNKDTYETNIHPWCNKFEEVSGEIVPTLADNCTLAIYRKEYDGTFTEIQKNINNVEDVYITDPHPALDYARYRIVATDNNTGSISYSDIPPLKIGETSIIIQWSEKWTSFNTDDNGSGNVEPAWSGSLLKLPYNVSVSDNRNVDVSLVKYSGRKRPVSYYGTQLSESSSWSVDIPKYDKETLYALRRLSMWTGDVYVREPSGTGYWATINVSYSIRYSDVKIPINLTVTRVEGGI